MFENDNKCKFRNFNNFELKLIKCEFGVNIFVINRIKLNQIN